MNDNSITLINCKIGNQTFVKNSGLDLKCFPYEIQPPVKTFKGRSIQLNNLRRKLTEKQIVVVSGRGGVGKTELAKKYAGNNKPVYQKYMFWVNAESGDTIGRTFKALFKTFYKCEQNIDHLDLMCIIRNVYECFEKPTLLVFDNATDQDSIKQYLPKKEQKNIHTIITTEDKTWDGIERIILNGVDENEAIDIFREIMKEKYNAERDEEHWKYLARKLGYLPLAIQIAGAYVYKESDSYNPDFTVAEYIEKLNKNAEILYEEINIARIFDLTLEKINQEVNKKKSPSSGKNITLMQVLNICAHLDPYFITMKTLLKVLKTNDEENLRDFLRTIDRYSLISSNGTNIYIHDELQHILRYRQEKNNENKDYFFIILKSLIDDEDMFYHCRQAMQYAENYPDIAVEFYQKTKSSKFLITLTQNGCYKALTKIFESMYQCGFYDTPYSKIKKHVLLYEAVLSCNVETVQLLLEYSKLVNVKNKYGWTPLRAAVELKCLDIWKLLVKRGASEEKTDKGVTQLQECLRDGHLRLAYILIATSSTVNLSDDDGNFPLHYVAKNPQLFDNNDFSEVIKLLMEKVENINAANKFGDTALHFAATHDNLKLANLLIDEKANICMQNKLGNTPLIEAAIHNRNQIVMRLGEIDSENKCVVMKNKKGYIALHYAVNYEFEEIAVFLAEKENNSTIIQNKIGNTSIHLAVITKNNKILKKLLDATSASINIANDDGRTPLKLAERSNNTEAIACLGTYMERYDAATFELEAIPGYAYFRKLI